MNEDEFRALCTSVVGGNLEDLEVMQDLMIELGCEQGVRGDFDDPMETFLFACDLCNVGAFAAGMEIKRIDGKLRWVLVP